MILLLLIRTSFSSFETDVTFVAKTHERPQSLRGLVTSIRKFYPTNAIFVADDGEVNLKFGARYMLCIHIRALTCRNIGSDKVRVLSLPYDVGLSAGRNALIGAVGYARQLITLKNKDVCVCRCRLNTLCC
jgi:hypothetical protein